MAEENKQPVQNKNIKQNQNKTGSNQDQFSSQKKDQNTDQNFDRDNNKMGRDQNR